MRWCGPLAMLASAVMLVSASSAHASGAEEQDAPDFSRAFAMLRDLGLPSVKNARLWEWEMGYVPMRGHTPFGWAWAWEREADGTLVLAQTIEQRTELSPDDKDDRDPRFIRQKSQTPDGEFWWNPSTASGQVEILRMAMPEARPHLNLPEEAMADMGLAVIGELEVHSFEDWRAEGTIELLARSLLLAAQLDERGATDAANRLAEAALGTMAGAEVVIGAAVNLLAETAYARAYHEFMLSGDHAAWQAALEDLLTRFPRGYANALVVRLILSDAESALRAEVTGPVEAGVLAAQWRSAPVDDATRAHLEAADAVRFASDRNLQRSRDEPVPWILNPTLADAPDPLGKLLANGADALPVLLAMAGDSSATPNPSNITRRPGNPGFSLPEGGAERVNLMYHHGMPRPATVSEMAAALILAALPVDEADRVQHPNADELDARVATWLVRVDPDDPASIADTYLDSGNLAQQAAALGFLLASPTPAHIERIEAHLLEARPRVHMLPMLIAYLNSRGSLAASFMERYRVRIEEETRDADEGYFREDWSASGDDGGDTAEDRVGRMLFMLGGLVEEVDFARLLGYVPDPRDTRRLALLKVTILQDVADRMVAEDATAVWLGVTLASDDPAARYRLLAVAPDLLFEHEINGVLREAWSKLFDDHRTYTFPEETGGDGKSGRGLAYMAADAFLRIQDREGYPRRWSLRRHLLADVMGDGLDPFMMDRARTLLAGEDAGPWPDEGRPGPEEMETLISQLDALDARDVAAAVEDLTVAEKVGLLAHEPAILVLGRASWFVNKIDLQDAHAELLPFVADWQGERLTPEMIEELAAALQGKGGKADGVTIEPMTMPPGVRVVSGVEKAMTNVAWLNEMGFSGVLVLLYVDRNRWVFTRLESGRLGPLHDLGQAIFEVSDATWEETVEGLFMKDDGQPLSLLIQIVPLAPEVPAQP